MKRILARAAALSCAIASIALVSTAGAAGTFVQPVTVLSTFSGPTQGQFAYFGWAVSELRDIDGDHVDDVIIGEVDGGSHLSGRVWVYSGSTGRLIYKLTGKAGDQNGFAVADAGDVDGDGVPDIISGAPGVGSAPGNAYVYSGANGRVITRLTGGGPADQFGAAVSGAGDVNDDGHADLLVGATGSGVPGSAPGHAYVISGRTFRVIRTLSAGEKGDSFGSATDVSPDLNGDGVSDLVVGASDAGADQAGAAYAYSGADGALLFRIPSPAHGGEFGRFFVAGVGDTNLDSVPDIFVGDYASGSNGAGSGYAAVYSGVDGSLLHEWPGAAAGEGIGPGREAGDVNGDGAVDLIIGSYTSSDGASQAGKVQVFSGVTGLPLRTITSTSENENLGFDAVGVGDVNHNGSIDCLVSAANLDTVYLIDGATP
jgi:hypothetical protein